MNNPQSDGDGLLLVRFKLNSENAVDFEKWESKAIALVKEYQGFVDITILDRLKKEDYYHILIRFECEENVNAWLHSESRKSIFNEKMFHGLSKGRR